MAEGGEHIGGVVGFLKNIRFLCEKFNPSSVCIAWEGGGSQRRRAIRASYKGKRRPVKLNRFYNDLPDTYNNRDQQLVNLIKIIQNLPVIQVYVSDCEGDDIIAHICNRTFNERKCIIVSSDKDFYQCISSRVKQWSPGRKKIMTPENVLSEFGILASNFVTTRAFVGDVSDGILGIKGAGFKTMAKRFPELSSVEDVILDEIFEKAKINNIKKAPAIYDRIVQNQERIRDNMKLMSLEGQNLSAYQMIKIDGIIENYSFTPKKLDMFRLFLALGIKNFDIDALWVSTQCLRHNNI
jgi:5'-3' exonuclease